MSTTHTHIHTYIHIHTHTHTHTHTHSHTHTYTHAYTNVHACVHIQEANVSYDFVNSDSDPTPEVDIIFQIKEGHGTSCAGIIGMEKDNHKCGVGVAYHAKLAGQLNKQI